MLKRLSILVLTLSTAVATRTFAADVPDADVALAARVSDFGTDLLHQKKIDAASVKACIAMLKAAGKLDPSEPRYPRLLVEACYAQRDIDGAIAALKAYRQIAPDDLGAQIELIQLNLGKMETADAKLAYAKQIMAANTLSADVRSAVAVMGAKLLTERGQQAQADSLTDQALRLNPLNIEALRMRYAAGLEGMSDYQKTQSLISMIKANPLQPAVVAELSERLADFGLVKPSLDWFYNAMKLYQKSNGPVPLDLAVDYAAEQLIAERYDGADGLAIRLLEADPNNVDALYLRLLCAKSTAQGDSDHAIRNFARKTLLARLTAAKDGVLAMTATPAASQPVAGTAGDANAGGAGGAAADPSAGNAASTIGGASATQPALGTVGPATPPAPTTDPLAALGLPTTLPVQPDVTLTEAALPDLSAAVAKLGPDSDSNEKWALVNAASDLAWYCLYFDQQPGVSQAMLDTLTKLLPADNVTLVRLQGWNLLQQNKPDEAKVKLSAVADRDALAALGLVKLAAVTDTDANNRGRRLLSDHPSKMLGAVLKDGLRDRGIKVVAGDKAQAISDQLDKFPIRWLNIIDKPSDFYLIRGVPLAGQFDYNEPMLVNITIQNLSEFDITVGSDGVIRNDLWIDADIPVTLQKYPGTAYDRVTQQVVLKARQSMSQVVRVDQGELKKVLLDNPTAPQQIWVTVLTNPITAGQNVIAGPGGYRVQLTKLIARAGFGMASDDLVNKMLDNLVQGTFGKISMMDLMSAYVRQWHANPADERLAKLGPEFLEKLTAVRIDPSPSVRGWAEYNTAVLAAPAAAQQQVQEMSRSQDWSTRLLGAVAATKLDGDARKSVLTELSNDPEPAVKDYAAAMLQVSPTTMPTSAPTTAP